MKSKLKKHLLEITDGYQATQDLLDYLQENSLEKSDNFLIEKGKRKIMESLKINVNSSQNLGNSSSFKKDVAFPNVNNSNSISIMPGGLPNFLDTALLHDEKHQTIQPKHRKLDALDSLIMHAAEDTSALHERLYHETFHRG